MNKEIKDILEGIKLYSTSIEVLVGKLDILIEKEGIKESEEFEATLGDLFESFMPNKTEPKSKSKWKVEVRLPKNEICDLSSTVVFDSKEDAESVKTYYEVLSKEMGLEDLGVELIVEITEVSNG